jgi:hypothetical protein
MIRLGHEARGIVGAGRTRTEPDEEPSVEIEFDLLSETPFISIERLQTDAPFAEVHWTIQGSGVSLPPEVVIALDGILENLMPTYDYDEYIRRASRAIVPDSSLPPVGIQRPLTVSGTGNAFLRDPQVRRWVLRRARGHCELCEQRAPFLASDGEPYLESHHITQLANGGSDTVDNTAAVCPNCHRNLHSGMERESLREKLKETVSKLEERTAT